MDDLYRNVDGLLGDYLHQWWAAQQGFDLGRTGWEDRTGHERGWRHDPREFLAWMKRHCQNVLINQFGNPPVRVAPGFHLRGWQEEMALLATVRFVAEFANGERVFLAGLETREPRADEIGEIKAAIQAVDLKLQGVPPARIEWIDNGLRGVRYSRHPSGEDWEKILWTGNHTFGSKLLPKLMGSKEREFSRAEVVTAGGFKGPQKGDDSGQTVERFHGSAKIRALLKAGIIDWPTPEAPLRLATDGPR